MNLVYSLSLIFVILKIYSISTMLQVVLGYPLAAVNASSLCCNSCYFVLKKHINLNPLIDIICASYPSSWSWHSKKSAEFCAMCNRIPFRRGCNLSINDCSVCHAERFLTFYTTFQSKLCQYNYKWTYKPMNAREVDFILLKWATNDVYYHCCIFWRNLTILHGEDQWLKGYLDILLPGVFAQ